MKITPIKIKDFLDSPLHFNLCLIYGRNFGKIKDYFNYLVKKAKFTLDDPFSTTILSFNEILTNPQILLNKSGTLSFHGRMRLLYIPDIGANLPRPLQNIFEVIDYKSTYIILIAQEHLAVNSSTRIYFENLKNAAVIPCYYDEMKERQKVVKKYLNNKKINYDNHVLTLLNNNLPEDRLAIYSELDKLAIYIGTKNSINEKDIINSVVQDPYGDIDDICSAFANQQIKRFLLLSNTTKNKFSIIRRLIEYFIRLYKVLLEIENGQDINIVINNLRPKMFFKHIAQFKNSVKLWQKNEIIHLLNSLIKLEIEYKSGDENISIKLERLGLDKYLST